MVDLYTKTVLTVIAVALAMIAVRPIVQPASARAAEPVEVRIVDVRMVREFGSYLPIDAALPVRCVKGCLSN
jgi:hypothetical protein